jgi:hypothetical protein
MQNSKNTASFLLLLCLLFFTSIGLTQHNDAKKIRDHEVVLDADGRLQPWTSYDNIIRWSLNFLQNCPTTKTTFGDDPWYLVTSKFNPDGTIRLKQNNPGSNVYWGVETLRKYYAYSGDETAFEPIKRLLERMLHYHTPTDWAWPDVPRTQDDRPDGEYTDEWGGVDKLCMAAIGYLNYYKLTGEEIYLKKMLSTSRTVLQHVQSGDANHSPLPFRVNFKTGDILAPYCSNMILAVNLIDELFLIDAPGFSKEELTAKKELLIKWILKYPMQNNFWAGYYEDVEANYENLNQQNPMETARYILRHQELDPDYKMHVPALIDWVKNRFGQTKHFGATSIREQDCCFKEMSSHTARYASIVAMWFGDSHDEIMREEARAAFALSTYSAYNKYSKNECAINYVGIGYDEPWFSDSYWDYLSHYFDGMAELPEMLPENKDHLFYSSSIVSSISYSKSRIEYTTFDSVGEEKIKLTFEPKVFADGKELPGSQWQFGDYRGVSNILRIKRIQARTVLIERKQ